MEKQNDSMRERLLARLPQPENLAAYREETASLLAKHEKAMFWEKMPSKVFYGIAIVLFGAANLWGQKLGMTTTQISWFWAVAAIFYFMGAINELRYWIYRSTVDTLKEVKQVQLQILEIEASLQKRSSE